MKHTFLLISVSSPLEVTYSVALLVRDPTLSLQLDPILSPPKVRLFCSLGVASNSSENESSSLERFRPILSTENPPTRLKDTAALLSLLVTLKLSDSLLTGEPNKARLDLITREVEGLGAELKVSGLVRFSGLRKSALLEVSLVGWDLIFISVVMPNLLAASFFWALLGVLFPGVFLPGVFFPGVFRPGVFFPGVRRMCGLLPLISWDLLTGLLPNFLWGKKLWVKYD